MSGPPLRERLRAQVMRAGWADLAPHFARGVLLVAQPELDLLEAGVAIASDDQGAVSRWLDDGQLHRATTADGIAWADEDPWFQLLILQPWLLVQRLPPEQAPSPPSERS
ncbi:MAG TPA: DUF2288 domain-containing protein [Deltaproteobacteria bacterium]|nr:DUF2288 domain-containing protein [Deltaproteobacteria bacterium]